MYFSRRVAATAVASLFVIGLGACSGADAAGETTPDDETSTSQDTDSRSDEDSGGQGDVAQFEGDWTLESKTASKTLEVDAQGAVSGGTESGQVSWEGEITANSEDSYTMSISAVGKDVEQTLTLTPTDDPDVWEYVDEVNGTQDVLERRS